MLQAKRVLFLTVLVLGALALFTLMTLIVLSYSGTISLTPLLMHFGALLAQALSISKVVGLAALMGTTGLACLLSAIFLTSPLRNHENIQSSMPNLVSQPEKERQENPYETRFAYSKRRRITDATNPNSSAPTRQHPPDMKFTSDTANSANPYTDVAIAAFSCGTGLDD